MDLNLYWVTSLHGEKFANVSASSLEQVRIPELTIFSRHWGGMGVCPAAQVGAGRFVEAPDI